MAGWRFKSSRHPERAWRADCQCGVSAGNSLCGSHRPWCLNVLLRAAQVITQRMMTILTDCNGMDGMGPGHALPIGARMTEKAPQGARPAACFPPISPPVFHFPPLLFPSIFSLHFLLLPCICIIVYICIHVYQQVRGGVRVRRRALPSSINDWLWSKVGHDIHVHVTVQVHIHIHIHIHMHMHMHMHPYCIHMYSYCIHTVFICILYVFHTCTACLYFIWIMMYLYCICIVFVCIPYVFVGLQCSEREHEDH